MSAVVRVPARPAVAPAGMAASAWLRGVVDGSERRVRILGSGPHATYAEVGDRTVLAIEGVTGAKLPNAVRITGVPRLAPDVAGVIGGGLLRVGPLQVRVRRWWDPRPRVPAGHAATVVGLRRHRDGLAPSGGAHVARTGLAGPLDALADAAAAHDVAAVDPVLDQLIGRGPGSTPSGDDVVAGLLATLITLGPSDGPSARFAAALGAGVTRCRNRTTPLSATLLRCASDGAVTAAASRVLALLGTSRAPRSAWRSAVAALASLGHTSGRDLLAGIAIGVDALIAERSQA